MRTGFPPDAFTWACFPPEPSSVLRRQVSFTRPFKSFSHLLLSWAAMLLLQFVHVIKYLKPFLFFLPPLLPHLGAPLEKARLTNRVSAPPGLSEKFTSITLKAGPEHCTCRCGNRAGWRWMWWCSGGALPPHQLATLLQQSRK